MKHTHSIRNLPDMNQWEEHRSHSSGLKVTSESSYFSGLTLKHYTLAQTNSEIATPAM